MAWLPPLLHSLGVQLNLISVLALFLCLAAARSLLNRQGDVYSNGLRLNFLRDTRVGLYSAIAHANCSFLRQRRPADLLSALTAETDRLDSAVYYARQLPGQAVFITANVAAACLIAPAPTFAALGVGLLLAWLVRGRLAESLRLGGMLSTAYQDDRGIFLAPRTGVESVKGVFAGVGVFRPVDFLQFGGDCRV
jgi:ABC-type transport system involved in cytochrome bd biosynthesis fused ATPase/permease subunit